ncbi:uncharacterized protein LOC122501136 [Leptopilina heterotoma]|uniref:uncharacterized protein LOC122501136 n=1 Tax=Leptopilina heterotoma TaxID=63436 RepID=UPI001CA9ED6B|nr:uncharacterized protein LOC122501136 [Leptopilina heterotoma]
MDSQVKENSKFVIDHEDSDLSQQLNDASMDEMLQSMVEENSHLEKSDSFQETNDVNMDRILQSKVGKNNYLDLNEKETTSTEKIASLAPEKEEEIIYTSDEEIASIRIGNWSTEVTGFVKTIIAPQSCGDNNQYQKMIFILSNEANSLCKFFFS